MFRLQSLRRHSDSLATKTIEDDVLEAVFVDDLAVVLITRTANTLWKAAHTLFKILQRVFHLFHLSINWNKGKTEVVAKFRGKGPHTCNVALRHGGRYGFVMDDGCFLHVVSVYKHLGAKTQSKGSSVPYARHRAQCAMNAYVPLAGKAFANQHLPMGLKLAFKSSLVQSALFYNAKVRCIEPRALRVLNGPYMRVVRMIYGESRFDESAKSDLTVKIETGTMSIDCVLRRQRLLYLPRLLDVGSPQLLSLLSSSATRRGRTFRMSWTTQLLDDMESLWLNRQSVRDELLNPRICQQTWFDAVTTRKTWWIKQVRDLFCTCSILDKIRLSCQIFLFSLNLLRAAFVRTTLSLQKLGTLILELNIMFARI